METTLDASLFIYSPKRGTLCLVGSSDDWFLVWSEQKKTYWIGGKKLEEIYVISDSSPKWLAKQT
jgi:hypothetical protein